MTCMIYFYFYRHYCHGDQCQFVLGSMSVSSRLPLAICSYPKWLQTDSSRAYGGWPVYPAQTSDCHGRRLCWDPRPPATVLHLPSLLSQTYVNTGLLWERRPRLNANKLAPSGLATCRALLCEGQQKSSVVVSLQDLSITSCLKESLGFSVLPREQLQDTDDLRVH